MTEPQHNPTRVLSFTDHLDEFRTRLIICITFFALVFLISLAFSPKIVSWLILPLTSLQESAPPDKTLTLQAADDGTLRIVAPGLTKTTETATSSSRTALTTGSLAGLSPDSVIIQLPHGAPPVRVGRPANANLYFLSPIEPFLLLMKGALLTSLAVSLPMIIYQLWLFIAPGLLRRERKIVKWLLLSSLGLFPAGALFAYLISSICLRFLIGMADLVPGLTPSIVASKGVGFILVLMIASGFLFEFPLVLVLLSRLGFITSETLVRRRRFAIVAITAIAAFGVPSPDPFSMVALMIPMFGLYEGSIWAIRALERADRAAGLVLRQDSV